MCCDFCCCSTACKSRIGLYSLYSHQKACRSRPQGQISIFPLVFGRTETYLPTGLHKDRDLSSHWSSLGQRSIFPLVFTRTETYLPTGLRKDRDQSSHWSSQGQRPIFPLVFARTETYLPTGLRKDRDPSSHWSSQGQRPIFPLDFAKRRIRHHHHHRLCPDSIRLPPAPLNHRHGQRPPEPPTRSMRD